LAARYPVPEPLQGALVAADFDRDARMDIASVGSFLGPGRPGAKVTFAFGDGQGGVRNLEGPLGDQPPESVWGLAEFPAALGPGELQAADLNGDGQLD